MRSTSRASARARLLPARILGALAGILTLLAVAGAPVASAHATLMSTDPADGAVLDEAPQRVAATFNEPMQDTFAAMTVVGPDGHLWSTGEAEVDGPVVSVAVKPLGPAGTYTANYRATSADGHVVSGSWTFEMNVVGVGEPGPPATLPDDAADDEAAAESDPPVWVFVAIAAVIVAGGLFWVMRRQR
ncbi:copper resistance CopC family protein [Mycolicibacterium thermoresistibile]